ncbi:tetratricopeptide repeat protein [Legionella brunensis]|uniref:TPR repeat containing protein n=1 Tax=Legionella brunensis TaxID=29422 RepID=A0A0W0S1Z7_9GAMM|nr:tetratricopeptide repeat protein [Legionella brunensis]KTC76981.1 TPR repeat containing protein [Legionella brunensis]
MRIVWLLLLLSVCCQSYSFSWQDLWFTKDQQAQTLMKEGQFKEAETIFQDQGWRGAAAYRAGNFKEAAEYYQSLQNEQGFYNQGNALAKLGQYEKAIKAYDKALAHNPNNKDAQFNRKLMEELLKKDKNSQANNQQNQDQQDNNQQQDKNQQNQGQQGNNQQQDKNQQNQDQQGNNQQQDKNQQNQGQQGSNQQQDKNQQNQGQQGSNQQQEKNQQNQDQQGNNQQQDKNQQNQSQQDKDKQGQEQQSDDKNTGVGVDPSAEREKQQAKEQWLRLIPDDPGGLLREKFLRDHIRRQGGWYQ